MTFNTYIAANTFKGFFSYFDELIYDNTLNDVYLIKGGPGCGKSTLMKKIAENFEKRGFSIEKIYCSSDPDSLDGIRIIELNKVIIDATPPHSFDMKYPGIIDNIIDISTFWDSRLLKQNKNDIKDLFDVISKKYKEVYSVLKSAGILYSQQLIESELNCDKQKVSAYIKKCIKQNAFTPYDKSGKVSNRFLSAISCNGSSTQNETISKLCEKGIIIEDEINLSSYIISKFVSYFKKSGFEVIVFRNPLCPEHKIDHIIVPKLRFGIVTSSTFFPINFKNDNFKSINTKNYINKDYISQNKNKISFRKKIVSQLLDKVTDDLNQIKELHDNLEKYYIDAINYDALDKYTKELSDRIYKN